MNSKRENILYVINPKSNENYARSSWSKARLKYPFLPVNPVDITQVDISSFIKKQKPTLVVIAGGDGTVNSVCTAINTLTIKPLLAIMPFGFGNALAYCFGVETLEKSMEAILQKKQTITIDAMITNIPQAPIGLFNIGVGFEARIVYNRMVDRYIGFRSYIVSALKSYLFHGKQEMTFTIDHCVSFRATASSLVIANCPVIGKNYVISSTAKLNDGLLDCTLFSTHFAYMTNLRLKGFKHPLYSKEGKTYFKAKHIQIKGDPFIQVDGDALIQKEGLTVEILPKQFTFLVNGKSDSDEVDL